MKTQITILEDDTDIREICTYIFMEEGYSVNGFCDIASFSAASTHPDIFLLDIMLPDGDGRSVCNKLKSDPRYSKIPVVMMSAHKDRNSVMAGCQADDFIEKPFDIENLLKRIAGLVA